jgi:SpoVK/Ycf46/Vps4 family AAA+-type ATPase
MNYPKKPAEQMNPFETLGRGGGKMKAPEKCEKAPNEVQGCGNPDCEICCPKDGRSQGSQGGADPSVFVTIDPSSLFAVSADEMRQSIERMYPFTFQSPPPDQRRAQLEQAERTARDPIKGYLLETKHSVAWDDVIGNADAKAALLEAIEHPVKFKELYAHYRKKPLKGVLLWGAPGCGKTMLAKACATSLAKLHGHSGSIMIAINGPDIQTPFVGQTERIIRQIFEYARAFKALHGYPLLIFIDEAEAILPSRDGTASGRRALPWEESQVATFLGEMDGMEESGAFVMLATNRPNAIDAALLREGRCDRKVKVERPTIADAPLLISHSGASAPFDQGFSLADLAAIATAELYNPDRHVITITAASGVHHMTLGDLTSGAMLVGLVERAKSKAFQRDMGAGGAPTGIRLDDVRAAVAELHKEQLGLNHDFAVREFIERHGLRDVSSVESYREAVKAKHDPGCLHCAIMELINVRGAIDPDEMLTVLSMVTAETLAKRPEPERVPALNSFRAITAGQLGAMDAELKAATKH